MVWTASVVVYVDEIRAGRPVGTIMGVSTPDKEGGYGPTTHYAVIDVTGVPDAVTLESAHWTLLRAWNEIVDGNLVEHEWRDVAVDLSLLPARARNRLNNVDIKRDKVTVNQFLSSCGIKRHARSLQLADFVNP